MSTGKWGQPVPARVLETVMLIVMPLLLHYIFPLPRLIPSPYSYLGAVLMLLGMALMVWASTLFRKAGTAFQLSGGGSALVTSGPFRFSRNPMYLGMLVWLLGMAVLLGSLIAFAVPVLLYLLAHVVLIPLEEQRLEEGMGEQYLEYKQRVRRWL